MSGLTEILETIREKLGQTRERADLVGDEADPTQQDKTDVDGWLSTAGTLLAQIHDEGTEPSLDPVDAGSAQSVTIPSSRLQTCTDAYNMIDAGYVESKKTDPNNGFIGDRTRTIQATYLSAIRQEFKIT